MMGVGMGFLGWGLDRQASSLARRMGASLQIEGPVPYFSGPNSDQLVRSREDQRGERRENG